MLSDILGLHTLSSYIYPNHQMVNMPNIFNLLLGIMVQRKEDASAVVQMIKLNMGLTFYESFRQYVIKKYPINHDLVLLVST
jgi:hypothetical protein